MKKIGKRLVAGILTAVSLFGAFAFTGCGETENKNEATNNTPSISEPTTPSKPQTPQYDGQIVQAGGKYNLSNKIAFLSSDIMPTSEGEYEPVSVTLTATVLPADANQAVNWRVSFANANSEWATGKTVTDYVSIATETEDSTTATVTCSAQFGEPIIIECISQDNPDIKAECTVDLLQGVESVSLTFGDDLPINLGGQTDVVWEINPSGIGKGGAANVVIDTTDTYTVAVDYSWNINLEQPSIYYNEILSNWGIYEDKYDMPDDASVSDGYFVLDNQQTSRSDIGVDCGLKRLGSITELIFDNAFLSTTMAGYCQYTAGRFGRFFSDLSTATMISSSIFTSMASSAKVGFDEIYEGSLYTLQLIVRGTSAKSTTITHKYNSLLYLTGYTNTSNVQSVTLDQSEIVL